jgi:hypothetical protein
VKLASLFLEVSLHLLLLISIVLIVIRKDLATVAEDAQQRCVPYTDPMIVLVLSQCQGSLRYGLPVVNPALDSLDTGLLTVDPKLPF